MIDHINIQLPLYFSYLDEKYFFAWLEEIDGIKSVRGGADGLRVNFETSEFSQVSLADLVALFGRYGVDMRPLRRFMTPENEAWLKDRSALWHSKVFEDKS